MASLVLALVGADEDAELFSLLEQEVSSADGVDFEAVAFCKALHSKHAGHEDEERPVFMFELFFRGTGERHVCQSDFLRRCMKRRPDALFTRSCSS